MMKIIGKEGKIDGGGEGGIFLSARYIGVGTFFWYIKRFGHFFGAKMSEFGGIDKC